MLKKTICLVAIILSVGCSTKEDSNQTYNYFKNFDNEKYNIVYRDITDNIENEHTATAARLNDEYYYDSDLVTIIQKNNKKYTLQKMAKTYTEENVTEYENFTYGLLPQEISKLKKYKSGKTSLYGNKLYYEEFSVGDNKIKYYFKKGNLKFIKSKGKVNKTIEITSINDKINKGWFNIPSEYTLMTY